MSSHTITSVKSTIIKKEEGSVVLTVGKKYIIVLKEWIPRWGFLNDLVTDKDVYKGQDIVWTYTPISDLITWAELNIIMDEKDNEVSILLSSIRNVVQYMSPTSAEYLMYVRFKDYGTEKERIELYQQLGRYIREYRPDQPYMVEIPYGSYRNFNIHLDPTLTQQFRDIQVLFDKKYGNDT